MHRPPHHRTFVSIAVVAAVFTAGCAIGPSATSTGSGVFARGELGAKIGVRAAQADVRTELDKPTGRNGPDDGAMLGMRSLLQAGAGAGEAAIVAVALLPVAAAVGMAADLVRSTPVDVLRSGEQAAHQGLALEANQSKWQNAFLDVANERESGRFVALGGLPAVAPSGVSVVAELQLDRVALQRRGLGDDSFALTMAGHVRWIRASDGSTLHETDVNYRSGTASFGAWADRSGKALERSADYGLRVMAEQVVATIPARRS